MRTAIYKLDDSPEPGLARVRVLGQTSVVFKGEERTLYRIQVLDIIRPSGLSDVRVRVGQRRNVSGGHLSEER